MSNQDSTYRISFANNQFRIFAADTTLSAQRMRDLHDLAPLPTIMMSRLITSAALVAMDIKQEYGEIVLRIDSQAPLKGGIVIISRNGDLRGYSFNPGLFFENKAENFNVGEFLKPGLLSVIRQDDSGKPFTGVVNLESGEIGEDLASYYLQSEQIPTAVNLGVLIDQHAKVRASGGFMIQQLPQADSTISDQIIESMNQMPNLSDLMDMGMTVIEILKKFILKEYDYTITETRSIQFHCNCSKERFSNALLLLGKDELETMREGIEPICHYCNTKYAFSKEDIQNIITRIGS
ncbi:MAG TPA: Hsp33 family molecular chaperone HslO [Candidatus Cloacimonadota bacterium]|mgnify:CR=1 FL=1|nr:Hsp33 family molecular chaperone HslO [Candidatus Cloacimonadota bacterium]HPS39278.1 Hsp33 family molecular chaperone HslO [Candidatus Cloacimonadota bacterium]